MNCAEKLLEPTLYTEKLQTFTIELNRFYRFVYHNDWLQNYCWLLIKSMKPYCVVVVNVLMPICCHIGTGMPYLHIFVQKKCRVIRIKD